MGMSAEQRAVDDPAENRPDHLQAGRTANSLAIAGSIAGGVFLVAGVAVLAAGVSKNKKAKTARTRVRPLVGPLSGVRVEF